MQKAWSSIEEMLYCFSRSSVKFQGHIFILNQGPGPRFKINMTSYLYRKSHCGDKTILRPSYLHNDISYTGKTTSLGWIGALVFIECCIRDLQTNLSSTSIPAICHCMLSSHIRQLLRNCRLESWQLWHAGIAHWLPPIANWSLFIFVTANIYPTINHSSISYLAGQVSLIKTSQIFSLGIENHLTITPILKLQFSISFHWFVSSHHLRIMTWDEWRGTSLMISQHWFRQWLGAVRQQAITWANVDLVPCRHMASVGPSELMSKNKELDLWDISVNITDV